MRPLEQMLKLGIVSITHVLSSGSVYLHSLLDSHPEIITIPGTPDFYTFLNKTYVNSEDALEAFLVSNPDFFDTSQMTVKKYWYAGLDKLGENKNEGIRTDKKNFYAHYLESMECQKVVGVNVILSIHYGYIKANLEDLSQKKIIVLHPHYHDKAIILNNLFKRTKCLVTVRDPIQTYYSAIKRAKLKAKLRREYFFHYGYLLKESKGVSPLINNNVDFRVLKVEDLGKRAEYIQKKVCKYLEITYSQSLLKSTFGGKLWWGANPTYSLNKFSPKRHSIQYDVPVFEKILFSLVFRKNYEVYGYHGIKVPLIAKLFALVFFFLPTREDLDWFKRNYLSKNKESDYEKCRNNSDSRIKDLMRLMKERIKLAINYYSVFEFSVNKKIALLKNNFLA